MVFIDKKIHANNVISWQGFNDDEDGRDGLRGILYPMCRSSAVVITNCERPLLNVNTSELFKQNGKLFDGLQKLNFDSFSLRFCSAQNDSCALVSDRLVECFYFFQHIGFVFLRLESELSKYQEFSGQKIGLQNITNFIDCTFCYKAAEDDVLWCRSSIQG
jgi:hypothetical protein